MALVLTACLSTGKQRRPETQFKVEIASTELAYPLARTIALQYLSYVSWYDYHGGSIKVEKCDGTENRVCHYYVSHTANGCGWGSYAVEHCNAGKCTYSFSPYDADIICE